MRYILFFISVFPCFVSGQYDHILADSSISWAAVFEMTLPADPLDSRNAAYRKMADLTVLKLQNEDKSFSRYPHHNLNALIWNHLDSSNRKYFSDAALTRPLTVEDVHNIIGTTATTFDPETFEEKTAIVQDAHYFSLECPLFKTRQMLIYNHARAKFDILPLAIAPAKPDGSVPFWMKFPIENQLGHYDLNSPDINWAVRYMTEDVSPRVSGFQVLKGGEQPIANLLFERVRYDTSIDLHFRIQEDPIAATLRDELFFSQAMICTKKPGYEYEFVTVRTEIEPEAVEDFQLVEEWVWDKKRQLLYVRLRAIAPRFVGLNARKRAVFHLKTGE